MRVAIAIGLCLSAAAIGAAFTVLTTWCGAMESSDDRPEAHCVSALHPIGPIDLVLGTACAAVARQRFRILLLVLGVVALALGILVGFSAGFFGIVPGVLLLAAGFVLPRSTWPDAPPPQHETM